MHDTGLSSVVKTSIPGSCHFDFKFTQTSVFSDFLKTVSDGDLETGIQKHTQIRVL